MGVKCNPLSHENITLNTIWPKCNEFESMKLSYCFACWPWLWEAQSTFSEKWGLHSRLCRQTCGCRHYFEAWSTLFSLCLSREHLCWACRRDFTQSCFMLNHTTTEQKLWLHSVICLKHCLISQTPLFSRPLSPYHVFMLFGSQIKYCLNKIK